MTDKNSHAGGPAPADSRRLLSDDDLAELLAAAYQVEGTDLTPAAKAAGFAALERRLAVKQEAGSRARLSGPWAMAAMIALGVASTLLKPPTDATRVKGAASVGLAVRLDAFRLAKDGDLVPLAKGAPNGLAMGDTVLFKATLPTSGRMALVIAGVDGEAKVRVEMAIDAAGVPTLIERRDGAFGLRLDEAMAVAKVCAIAEGDAHDFSALVERASEIFPLLDGEACIGLTPDRR